MQNRNPYRNDLRSRQAETRENASRRRLLGEHRDEVERAVSLNREATGLEEQIRQFDDLESGFAGRVDHAKKDRLLLFGLGFTCLIIGIADFVLATPDVAETLANKSMSLVKAVGAAEGDGTVTPVWLRISIGLILTVTFLLVTAWVKYCGDTTAELAEIEKLQPGEDAEYRRLRNRLLLKRGIKIGYLILLGVLFYFLYTYDLGRARLIQDIQVMNAEASGMGSFNLEISGPDLGVAETSGQPEPGDSENAFGNLARPALVVYAILWLLHFLLILVRNVAISEDRGLAQFKRSRAGERVVQLREKEGSLLRALYYRIDDQDGEIRGVLIRQCEAVAARIKEVAGPLESRGTDRNLVTVPAPQHLNGKSSRARFETNDESFLVKNPSL